MEERKQRTKHRPRAWGSLVLAALAIFVLAKGAGVRQETEALARRERDVAEALKLAAQMKANVDRSTAILAQMNANIDQRELTLARMKADHDERERTLAEMRSLLRTEKSQIVVAPGAEKSKDIPNTPPVVPGVNQGQWDAAVFLLTSGIAGRLW